MPVAMEADGQTYYLACDQVGSLRAVADASGTVVKAVTYDSFGNVLEDSNESLTVPFGFAGGLYDAYTGLVRFGYRDYDAEVGRWTAKDLIGFNGEDSDLYGYCGNNSVTFFDDNGLISVDFSISGGGVDVATPIYDDKDGEWFPGVPGRDNISFSTTLIGAGFIITPSKDYPEPTIPGELPCPINMCFGASKYTAICIQFPEMRPSLAVGIGIGSPATPSISLEDGVKYIKQFVSYCFSSK